MVRAGRAVVTVLLLASLAAGVRQLTEAWRLLPASMERSLSRTPAEQKRWLAGIANAVGFAEASTPRDADIELLLCRAEARHVFGAPYTLFPRRVRVLEKPSGRDAIVVHACPEEMHPHRRPEGREVELAAGSHEVALEVRQRGPMLGLLFSPGVQGRVAVEDGRWRTVIRVAGGRALFRQTHPLGPSAVATLQLAQPSRAAVDARGRPLATGMRTARLAGYRHDAEGRTVVLSRSVPLPPAAPSPLPPGSLPRGALAIPLLVLLGLTVVRCVPLPSSACLRLALGWGAGCGTFALADFLLGLGAVPPAGRIALMAAGAAILASRPPRWLPSHEGPTQPALRIAFGVLTGLATIVLLAYAILFPRDRQDSYAFWGVKAKALYLDGTLTADFLARDVPHQDYPPLGAFLESVLFRAGGGVDDRLAAIPSPVSLLAIGLALAGSGGTLGTLAGAAMMTNPRVAYEAVGSIMDVHVALYVLLGLVVLDRAGDPRARGGGSTSVVALGGALLAFAGFTKNDGLPCAIAAAAVGIAGYARGRIDRTQLAALVLAMGAVLAPWLAFRAHHGLRTDIVNARIASEVTIGRLAGQLRPALGGLARHVLSVSGPQGSGFDGAFAAVAAGVVTAIAARRGSPALAIWLGAVTLLCLVYVWLPPRRLDFYFQTTGFRVPMQLLPAGLYVALRGTEHP